MTSEPAIPPLAMLQRFPLDTIKIDRSFISDIDGTRRTARWPMPSLRWVKP